MASDPASLWDFIICARSIELTTSTLCKINGSSLPFSRKTGGLFQTAAGVQQNVFARNFDVHRKIVVGFQILDDLISKVMNVDYRFLHAKQIQSVERDFQQRAAGDFYQGFWLVVGQRPEARYRAAASTMAFIAGPSLRLFHRELFADGLSSCSAPSPGALR